MSRRSAVAGAAVVLSAGGLSTAQAIKPKPLAYEFKGGCKGAVCKYNAIVNPAYTTVALSVSTSALCESGVIALDELQLKVRHGHASGKKVVSGVTAKASLTVKKHKSVVGTYSITTSEEACAANTGKTVHVSMKYGGPVYGG